MVWPDCTTHAVGRDTVMSLQDEGHLPEREQNTNVNTSTKRQLIIWEQHNRRMQQQQVIH
jgi:hypothetical protein